MEKIDTEYSNIIDQAKKYLYNRKDESSSITGTVLQQDEIDAQEKIKEIKRKNKKNKNNQSLNELNWRKKYKTEEQVLDEKLGSEGKKSELPKNKVLDIPGANSSGDLQSRN